jgi:DnaK suppressor protein
MALLTRRSNKPGRSAAAPGPQDLATRDARTPSAGRVAPAGAQELAVARPEEALLTLQARLLAQLDTTEEHDGRDDPETRPVLLRIQRRLDQVNTALARIEQGLYGICAGCHKRIESDRLALQPVTTRCVTCQTAAEWRGATD